MPPRLRVAVVTESFLPSLNGVTTSVCRVLEHLRARGDEAVVICPGPAPAEYAGFRVVGVPAFSYRSFPVGVPTPTLQRTLAGFAPDVVHVASPFVLGAAGLAVARRLGLCTVAIYQTDVAGFARRHHAGAASATAWRWLRRLHAAADLTLAPSTSALADLRGHGVERVALWARGVDAERFHPARRNSPPVRELRAALAGPGEVLVGYVGRLAPEKRVERLAVLADLPGVRTAVVGDGPSAPHVARRLPGARMLGRLDGDALAEAFAALDVFVHTGTEETFGQTLQEAMASGVPVVAPASGGPLDLVQPGVTGLLYDPEDDAGLRAAVTRLAADAALRQQLGTAARRSVEPRSWTTLGEELVRYYRHAMAGRALASAPAAGTSAAEPATGTTGSKAA
jgi:phosphatidylinositol alpha 1,6-mannosyltransferase